MGLKCIKHVLLPKVTYKNTGLILLRFSHQWLDLAAQNGWVVNHLDVKSAFLRGDLKEEVYVTQPDGYVYKKNRQKVFKLYKALYGLRQAPRA